MIINHNMNALNAHRSMIGNTAKAGKSMEKLSSGLRINRAGDDAAGLAISEKMRGQIRGLDQAARNGQDSISMIQTAEGALNETHSILQRMRELSVQSANGSNTDADRGRIQEEVTQLADEINRIGNTTEFNTQKLINGSKDLTQKDSAVKNASSVDKIGTGADKFTVRATGTAGEVTGATISGSTTIHSGTEGKYTLGAVSGMDGTGTALATAGIDGAHNELTVSIHGVVRSFSFDDTAATDAAMVTDMQTKIRTAFAAAPAGAAESGAAYANAANISVSIVGGKIEIADATAGKGADSKVSIVGGNAASILSDATDVKADGAAANNQLTVDYSTDGSNSKTQTITLADGTYNTPADLATEIETKFNAAAGGDATDLDFSAAAGATAPIKIATDATHIGKGAGITGISGSAAAYTGLVGPGAVNTLGENANNKFDIVVDGQTYSGVEIAGADTDFTDKDILANAIQTAINSAITTADPTRDLVEVKALSVADTDRVRFQISSGKEGTTSNITFGAVAGNDGMADLGFNTVTESGHDGTDASVSYQIGANKDQNLKLAFGDMRSEALGITRSGASATSTGNTVTKLDNTVADVTYGASSSVENGATTEYVIDVTSVDSANDAVDVINNAIELVSKERSKLGANQNRLEHTIANLGTASENLTSAESRIRDVDMAKEMMNYSKENILQQAAQAMLAQAKQAPQGVLQLLR